MQGVAADTTTERWLRGRRSDTQLTAAGWVTVTFYHCYKHTTTASPFTKQDSWVIAKTTARCAQYMGARKISSPDYPTTTFPELCNGRLFRSILRTCLQNLKFVALPVPEIIGCTQKISAVPGYAHAPFSPKFLAGFCSHGHSEYTCQVWSL